MSNFHFRLDRPQLATLLHQIHAGELQRPDFQRSWFSDHDRYHGLLASVSLGWPVAAILQCGGEVRFRAHEFEVAPPKKPNVELRIALEGRQRLTPPYLSLRSGKSVDTLDAKGKAQRLYFFDIRACLDPDTDRTEAIRRHPTQPAGPVQLQPRREAPGGR